MLSCNVNIVQLFIQIFLSYFSGNYVFYIYNENQIISLLTILKVLSKVFRVCTELCKWYCY